MLDQLPRGTSVFVDANIFLYEALNGRKLFKSSRYLYTIDHSEKMKARAVYEDGILKLLEKIGLEEKQEIVIEIKKPRRMKGILKADQKIVDEVIAHEEFFE